MSLKSYDRLLQSFTEDQARAIVEATSADLVTRDYLDARLQALHKDLLAELHKAIGDARNAGFVFVFVCVSIATSVLLFALPRLIVSP